MLYTNDEIKPFNMVFNTTELSQYMKLLSGMYIRKDTVLQVVLA